jgi:hypothetical protein
MQHLKTPKPATARHGEPVSNGEWLGSELEQSNTPSPAKPQAPWRPPADVVQSDHEYFVRHPGARHRFRVTKRVEFSRVVIVIATVTRDGAGRPTTIFRDFYRYEGGRA